MPKLSEFYGIKVYIYPAEPEYEPPHFHAKHAGVEVRYHIGTLEQLDTNAFPPAQSRRIRQWATLYQSELADNWERIRDRGDWYTIPPLK